MTDVFIPWIHFMYGVSEKIIKMINCDMYYVDFSKYCFVCSLFS